ncbi:MAG: cell division protein FtsZ [Candidatus Hydrogenedentales bacterium]|jgi:cell division protein FtsZ
MDTFEERESFDKGAVIKVCGVGGGGGNAVNRMIEAGMTNVDFIAINTDAMDLKSSLAATRLQIGRGRGLGAGAKPEVGRQSCEDDRERVRAVLEGADMVFLAAGLGGGTGTGASPIVAEEASAAGALVVAIVTLPFSYEGKERMDNALAGLEELEEHVDSLIVVPNDRIAYLSDKDTRFIDSFRKGDEVLHDGVRAISQLITEPGLINVDFADVRTVMEARGRALMGIGVAEGNDRALRAAQEAITCPLLEQSTIEGAQGVIINVRGGEDLRTVEVNNANEFIMHSIGNEAKIVAGTMIDKDDRPEVQITVIAAGFPKRDPSEYTKPRRMSEAVKQSLNPTPLVIEKAAPVSEAAKPSSLMPEINTRPETAPISAAPKRVMPNKPKPEKSVSGQKELPLGVPMPAEVPEKEEVNLSIPAFLRRAMNKK